tara:strand:- start:312 stop:536 length:225 start_codon:yes stop_codon:yes gene_type:complete
MNDYNRISTEKGKPNSKWGRIFRSTFGRWRMFRVSDKADATNRYTPRCGDVVRDDLLRPHLFGVIRGRYDGLGR